MIRVGTLKEVLDVADDVDWNAGKRAGRNDDPRDALEKPPIVGGDRTRDERQECKGFEKASPAQISVERVDLEKHVIQWLHVHVGPLGKAQGAGKVAQRGAVAAAAVVQRQRRVVRLSASVERIRAPPVNATMGGTNTRGVTATPPDA